MRIKQIQLLLIFALVAILFVQAIGVTQDPYSNEVGASTGPHDLITGNHAQPVKVPAGINVNSAVNPTQYYTHEPAPMGITDFGVGPGGSPYYYNTTSFLGTVQINSLRVYGPYGTNMSFQLNVNLQFNTSSGSFEYWIQDVLEVNTTLGSGQGELSFWDNIWNQTSSNLPPSTLKGNGLVTSGFYYDFAGALPGNSLTIPYPSTIQFKVVSYNTTYQSSKVPAVSFAYNDGYGWQTYDNVYFIFATNLVYNSGFIVNGYNYAADGLFSDAEMVMGGPYNGYNTTIKQSNVNFSLDYYNGHNYQSVRNAYNFGSDTAEALTNVTAKLAYSKTTGQMYVSCTLNNSTLSMAYNSTFSSWMKIGSTLKLGYLYVNGTNVTEFINNSVNITIAPGTYHFEILNPQTGQLLQVGDINFVLLPGIGQFYQLGGYNVTFNSTNLVASYPWYVNISDLASSGPITSQTYTITLSNGSYSYHISSSANLFHPEYIDIFTVNGHAITENISFTAVTFVINITESGLPVGELWYVNLSGYEPVNLGKSNVSALTYMTFTTFNGTYLFSVGKTDSRYVPQYSSYSFTVSGKNKTVSVIFVPKEYTIYFDETGLPSTVKWNLDISNSSGTVAQLSGTGNFSDSLPNGSYSYSVSTVDKLYAPTVYSGPIAVNGKPVFLNVSFSLVTYAVYFRESSLPAGIQWSVAINGTLYYTTGTSLSVRLPNGSYSYVVQVGTGYYPNDASGNLTVNGFALSESVSFTAYSYITGIISPTSAKLYINGNLMAFNSSGTFNFTLKNGSYQIVVKEPGYQTYNKTFNLTSGETVHIDITLSPVSSPSYLYPLIFGIVAAVLIIGGVLYIRRKKSL
jgi:hypothetical protein